MALSGKGMCAASQHSCESGEGRQTGNLAMSSGMRTMAAGKMAEEERGSSHYPYILILNAAKELY